MLFVITTRSRPDADRTSHEQEEYRLVDALHERGFFVQIYKRLDDAGALAIVEAGSADEVRAELDRLPFHRDGLIELVDLYPVQTRW